jgi:hypothetical protein
MARKIGKRIEASVTVTLNSQAQRKTVTIALPKQHLFTKIFFEVHTEFTESDLGGKTPMLVVATEDGKVLLTQNEEVITIG